MKSEKKKPWRGREQEKKSDPGVEKKEDKENRFYEGSLVVTVTLKH